VTLLARRFQLKKSDNLRPVLRPILQRLEESMKGPIARTSANGMRAVIDSIDHDLRRFSGRNRQIATQTRIRWQQRPN
jgi:hypothetical protein